MNKNITELVAADPDALESYHRLATDDQDPETLKAVMQAVIEALRGQQDELLAQNRALGERLSACLSERDYYRSIFNALPAALWLLEGERLVDANPAGLRLLGVEAADELASLSPDSELLARAALAAQGELQRMDWRHGGQGPLDCVAELTLASTELKDRRLVLGSLHDVTLARAAEGRLAASERRASEELRRLRELLQGTSTGLWEWDLEADRFACNERWAEIMGRHPESVGELNFAAWCERIHPEDLDHALLEIRRCCAREIGQFRVELRVRHSEGHWVWTVERGKVVQWAPDGRPLVMAGTCGDITRHKQAQEQLKLAASVFTHASEGIMITDADVRIVSVNKAFTRITGYTQEDVVGLSPSVLRSGMHGADYYQTLWQSLRTDGYWSGEIWNRHKQGHLYAELVNISAVYDEHGHVENYVALFTDITALKNHQQQLEHSANYDALTDLPNRLLLADRLHLAMARSRRHGDRIAVAYIDLDGFKAINDQHGHDVGDQLLVTLSGRMKAMLREHDTLARLGGDEFVAVIVDLVRHQDSVQVIERLLQSLADPVVVGDAVLHVSASIGVTLYPLDDVDADQLLRHADQAMYIAKQTGKNRYHVFDIQRDRIIAPPEKKLDGLRMALEQGELTLHYQPWVNMRTGQVVGAEALLRWQHPERGLLLPAEFLPYTEHHTLATAIGNWVIDQALSQIAVWQSQGLDIPVSVNLSARHLQQRDFIPSLKTLLRAHPSVDPSRLELELLEANALEDIDYVGQIIRACHGLGMRFALDDFGTGYTSLNYLRRLPADVLKLDRSFVQSMPAGRDALAMVEAVTGMAGAFRRELVAEGVETEWQGEMLLALGCELAQGYAIARPMPAAELPGWIDTWQPPVSWSGWREGEPSGETLPVLLASVEHRIWRDELLAFLDGRSAHVPVLDPHQCTFSRWFEDEGRRRFGEAPGFEAVRDYHFGVHAMAEALVGGGPQAKPGVEQFSQYSDELLRRLRELAWPQVEQR